MESQLIWGFSGLLLSLQVIANDMNATNTTNNDFQQKKSATQITHEYYQDIGSEQIIRWNIQRGTNSVEYGDNENCLDSTVNEPLCEICLQAMNKTFSSEENEHVKEASFMQGTLVFPNTNFSEKLIDIIVCTYNPIIGVARFYLTRGKNEKSAYFINNAGVHQNKHRFTLEGKHLTWN